MRVRVFPETTNPLARLASPPQTFAQNQAMLRWRLTKIHEHVHALQMAVETASPAAAIKTMDGNTIKSATGTGTVSRGATVVVVEVEGGAGVGGLVEMLMHSEIGR